MEKFTEEIHRILNAPYAVSLKGLLNVTREADEHLLELWALSHPCEIEMVVSVVVDGLSWCPFAAPVLENLVIVERMRGALLHRRPMLLDTLLKKTVVSQQGFEKHSQICVSMLSAPLPIPTPASFGPFFHRSLEEATASPTASNLRRVYSIVSGQCSALPEILSAGQMTQVQEKLIGILKRLDGQAVHLFCLGTFARLMAPQKCPSSVGNTSRSSISSVGSDSSPAEKRFGLIQGFFSAQKASKTIDLVVLRVISACSSNSNLSSDEALEDVQLATVIMDAVEPGLRGAWVKSNGRTVRKLYEKVLRRGIANLLQFSAFGFVLRIVDPKSLPPAIPQGFQALISSRLQCQTIGDRPIRLSTGTLEKMAVSQPPFCERVSADKSQPCFEEDFLSEVLCTTMTILTQLEPSVVYLSRLKDCQIFLDGLNKVVEDSPIFRRGLFSALSTNEFEKPFRKFCEISIPERRPTGSCATLELCWTELQESRRRLAVSFCLLVLKAVLHSSGDEIGLETSLGLSLLRKQKDIAVPMPPCPSARYNREVVECPPVAFLEQKSTPQDVRVSHEWKSRLAESLMRDATQRHEAIVRTVSEVCRELEERCEDVERPLRDVQAKLGSVQTRFDEAKRRVATLELEASERELFLDGLDAEKAGLQSEVSSLSERNLDLERLLQQASVETHDIKVTANDEMKKLEFSHLATLTIKDENITDLEQKIERMEHDLGKFDGELGLARNEKVEAEQNLLILQEELSGVRIELEQGKTAISLNHTEIKNLSSLNDTLRTNVEALNNDLRESSARLEEIVSESRERQRTLCSELELAAKTELLHNEEMDNLRALLRAAQQDLSLERQRNDHKIIELEKEIKEMCCEREERAKEFMHAQDLSRRLMAAMRVGNDSPGPQNLTMGRKETTDILADDRKDQFGDRHAKTPHSGNNRRHGRDNSTCERDKLSRASARSGPTPKRLKVHNQVEPTSTRQTKVMAGMKTAKPGKDQNQRNERSPLKELTAGGRNEPQEATARETCRSPDSRPDRPSAGCLDERVRDIENFSLDGSELFTSTQTPRGDPSHQDMNERESNIFDESTAEF
ncbi:hypothetical protein GP486_002475 [Trichoglossum hirsutum]|uniref:Uncharacterized protein n=1 Tax=Trichoglossum hirsutum TaxID=265104 RepID=A0A9P8LER0_9PEZI|nr:hypothetical protein GP486_002475 [Trichoglossum hirsutum]